MFKGLESDLNLCYHSLLYSLSILTLDSLVRISMLVAFFGKTGVIVPFSTELLERLNELIEIDWHVTDILMSSPQFSSLFILTF